MLDNVKMETKFYTFTINNILLDQVDFVSESFNSNMIVL